MTDRFISNEGIPVCEYCDFDRADCEIEGDALCKGCASLTKFERLLLDRLRAIDITIAVLASAVDSWTRDPHCEVAGR